MQVPAGVTVTITPQDITVKGPKGELKRSLPALIKVTQEGTSLSVALNAQEVDHKMNAAWGLYRALINNMIIGVTTGYIKQLEINGIGYTAAAAGTKLNMKLGFSHPIVFELPKGISATVEKNVITLSGIDNQLLGEVAANIRKIRQPEPYQGKGIKYIDEVIRRKVGKAAGKAE